YQAAGDNDKAIAIFRNIYLTMPLTGEADLAGAELKKLGTATPAALGTLEERKTRAELLLKGKRYASAAEEYSDLLDQVSPADRPNIQLALASGLQRSGRAKDARKVLESLQDTTGEVNAQRLYLLGEVSRASNDEDAFLKNLDQLRQQAPNSPWLEQGLLSAGNIYLLKKDYDRAIDAYRELQQRF